MLAVVGTVRYRLMLLLLVENWVVSHFRRPRARLGCCAKTRRAGAKVFWCRHSPPWLWLLRRDETCRRWRRGTPRIRAYLRISQGIYNGLLAPRRILSQPPPQSAGAGLVRHCLLNNRRRSWVCDWRQMASKGGVEGGCGGAIRASSLTMAKACGAPTTRSIHSMLVGPS